jgi:hypothetical protein
MTNFSMTRDAMRREKMDKRTALPLSIPKNGRRFTKRRPILDVHDVKQQRSQSSAHARAIAPRACTDRQLIRCARRRECGRAQSAYFGSVAFGHFTGPSGPSCLLAEGGGPPPVSPVAWIPAGSLHSVTGGPLHARRRPPGHRIVGTTLRSGR